jgi:hypothetical protein
MPDPQLEAQILNPNPEPLILTPIALQSENALKTDSVRVAAGV